MKRNYKWLFGSLILLISVGAYLYSLQKPIPVEAQVMEQADLSTTFTALGTLMPTDSRVINATVSGKIQEMSGKQGMALTAGESLARIGGGAQTNLEIQREQYRQQLTGARQEYDSMFGSGGLAEAGQKAAESEYRLLEKQYNNGKLLADQGGYISQAELDQLKAGLDRAWQQVLKAREANSKSSKEAYESLIASYERQLEMMETTVQEEVLAMPYDGVVWERYCDPGEFVVENQPVVKIYDPGKMKIEVSLLSEDAVLLKTGEQAVLTFGDRIKGEGTITFISLVAGTVTSSIGMEENRSLVELATDSIPEGMGAGYGVDVTFRLTEKTSVLSLPLSALVPLGEGDGVYRIAQGKAVLIPVETGAKSGGRIEVISGVEAGDVVLTDPYADEVKDGSRVRALVD